MAVQNAPESIRIATPADAAQITSVINSAFRIAEGFFVDGARITQAEVEQLLVKGAFLLAEDGDNLNGCVYVELRGERSYLGLLSVDPSCQKGGLGSVLMLEAENYCRERGSHYMDIYIVNLREELPPFYQRRGYVNNGTTPFPEDIPTKVPCHFINMTKPL
ncbi:MAG TPA: GNAT family N-acetyltransferase [Pyrinomonadaceae bacterium]|nr:GNAT family N-acetyltransferase [Pyrinomonadaceae bacterium]